MDKTEKQQYITDKNQLIQVFKGGIKPEKDFKIGMEVEKIGVNSNTGKAAPYSSPKGVLEFIKRLKNNCGCNFISEDDSILGLTNCGLITLEPGSQLEISTSPKDTVHDLKEEIKEFNTKTAEIAAELDISWLGYGIQPVSVYDNIELIPKKRYDIMTEYLPQKGSRPLVMMKESAGIQVALDYSSEEDFSKKFRTALALSPIFTAIFANSPIRAGKETEFKSYRAYGWLDTDKDRCGLVSQKIFEMEQKDFGFDDYAEVLLNLPMMFLQREGIWFNMKGLTFKDYLKNGYNGYKATIDDWNLHLTSFFPEVRLKNYLELRNMDCQREDMAFAIPALWKGIMYDKDAMESAYSLVKGLSWNELSYLRESVPKFGLNTPVKAVKIIDLANELVDISEYSLNMMAKNINSEAIYLEPLKENLAKKETPADRILNQWNGEWNKDINRLIQYCRLT